MTKAARRPPKLDARSELFDLFDTEDFFSEFERALADDDAAVTA